MGGHHLGKIPQGLLSPEGRCQPSTEPLLSDGLPCLTHESCSSNYCHFDTRLQYFFSDHDRVYHPRHREQVAIPDQLHSMQVQEVMPANGTENRSTLQEFVGSSSVRPLHEFVGVYNSYEGVKYATTGTCATTCPKSAIG